MEPEIIDWNNIDSVFIEDDTYENLNAPKWVDFSTPDEQLIDDDDWFCNPDCKHHKTAEDYLKSKLNSKVKFLKSVSISEMLPFRDRTCRDAKLTKEKISNPQTFKAKGSESAHNFSEDSENKNPNSSSPPLDANTIPKNAAIKSSTGKKQCLDDSQANSSKPRLRSTFSARNLFAGRGEVLNQITQFCSELKKLAKKGSNKESTEKISSEVLNEKKGRVREKERMPLLEVKKKGGIK